MREAYSEEQKRRIMLRTDLLGEPLNVQESAVFDAAVEQAGGVAPGLEFMSSDVREKARGLLDRGLKLSLELDKLAQRGISIRFFDGGLPTCMQDYFTGNSPILFLVGNRDLLEECADVALSLDEFNDAGFTGILIADRPMESLLRDKRVSAGLRASKALVVSDLLRGRARIKSLDGIGSSDGRISGKPQKNVFISGSRSQTMIPPVVRSSLEMIIAQGIGVLIGDSSKGVDNEIADYLRSPLYRHVTLYTIAREPRIAPEPEWDVVTVEVEDSQKAQQRQMVKDRAMADKADWGLALFNPIEKNRYGAIQVSSGTLRNAVQMLLQGKMVKFFYRYEGAMLFENLKTVDDLETVLSSYWKEVLDEKAREIILSAKGVSQDDDPAAVKAQKIIAKFEALRKAEEKLLEPKEVDTMRKSEQISLILD